MSGEELLGRGLPMAGVTVPRSVWRQLVAVAIGWKLDYQIGTYLTRRSGRKSQKKKRLLVFSLSGFSTRDDEDVTSRPELSNG